MKVEQRTWNTSQGWNKATTNDRSQLVLVFGSRDVLAKPHHLTALRQAYPNARLFGCSTAGEIADTNVRDDTIVATALQFHKTSFQMAATDCDQPEHSRDAGIRLAGMLPKEGLVHVLVLSDGQRVNGSDLVAGLRLALPPNVQITGGLAGDGARFEHTLVLVDGDAKEGRIGVVGLYGDSLKVGFGSLGGWDPFGPQRLITRSDGNVLFELDGQPALALYKRYLGEHAKGLPATGLLFPLSLQTPDGKHELTRTILNVNEADQSLTFAGDIPQGHVARLMKANFDRLVDGAHGAAEMSTTLDDHPELALLISCVGRKLVLKQRTEDELEAVREVIGPEAVMTGFYSYGEVCPSAPGANCELHNQTMTITTLSEN
jgi:hypothetical protein